MKRVQYSRYGGPEVMRLEEFTLPAPKEGEVRVKVKAAATNPIDWKLRLGVLKFMTGKVFPRPMGAEFSGVVEAVGPGVDGFRPGDAVFGGARMKPGSSGLNLRQALFGGAGEAEWGAYAEGLITDVDLIAKKPDAVSFEDAACLSMAAMTAWIALIETAKVKPGQRVFVSGCMGAVGQAAVQLARHLGASVAGSCGTASMAAATALGVDPVVDYAIGDHGALAGQFDVVFETSGGMPVKDALALLKRGGVLIDINPTPSKFLRSFLGGPIKFAWGKVKPDILAEIGRLAAEGKLRISIGRQVPLSGAIGLIKDLEGGQRIGGKGVVVMD